MCGQALDIEDMELDHIVPTSDDGEDVMENLAIVCGVVNRMKGAMSYGEFLRVCEQVVKTAGPSEGP